MNFNPLGNKGAECFINSALFCFFDIFGKKYKNYTKENKMTNIRTIIKNFLISKSINSDEKLILYYDFTKSKPINADCVISFFDYCLKNYIKNREKYGLIFSKEIDYSPILNLVKGGDFFTELEKTIKNTIKIYGSLENIICSKVLIFSSTSSFDKIPYELIFIKNTISYGFSLSSLSLGLCNTGGHFLAIKIKHKENNTFIIIVDDTTKKIITLKKRENLNLNKLKKIINFSITPLIIFKQV